MTTGNAKKPVATKKRLHSETDDERKEKFVRAMATKRQFESGQDAEDRKRQKALAKRRLVLIIAPLLECSLVPRLSTFHFAVEFLGYYHLSDVGIGEQSGQGSERKKEV